ncbi:MAG: hypothetical protein EA391_05465 [Balneolaceae bacterium]|nr:MAG: hypothetical protein EA391_05465 [Balneolaceae bacterium]
MGHNQIIHNEKGYALAAVLIVLVLITLIIGFMMMGFVMQNRFIQKDIHSMKARYLAEAGIWHFLSDRELWGDYSRTHFIVTTADSQKVFISRNFYGGYWKVIATAEVGQSRKSIQSLIGEKPGDKFDHAVILGDVRTPIVLTGSTLLTGPVISGQEGVQTRPFRGEQFSGSFSGEVTHSDSSALPLFNKELIHNQFITYRSWIQSPPEHSFQIQTSTFNQDSHYSLNKNINVFYRTGNLHLNVGTRNSLPDSTTWIVSGNIKLTGDGDLGSFSTYIAADTIYVDGTLTGDHALFYASKMVHLNGNSQISAQLFSEGDILLEDKSYLRYPSLIYVKPQLNGSVKTGTIQLLDDVIVDGMVMLPDVDEGIVTEDKATVKIADGALVRGAVYNTSRTEMSGTIYGSVLTNSFYFYISPTVYLNWLKDTRIEHHLRPQPFVVPIGFDENLQFEILYWNEV